MVNLPTVFTFPYRNSNILQPMLMGLFLAFFFVSDTVLGQLNELNEIPTCAVRLPIIIL
jgi:hypothetical protein